MPSDRWSPWPDPKTLCQTILREKMPDSSKYQFGRTKIFFRAGSLAEMDAARSAKAETILSLVRRNMLRYRAVKYLREARGAVLTIQRWWRHILAWRAILKLRGEALALAKQRALRSRRTRNGDATPTSRLAHPSVDLALQIDFSCLTRTPSTSCKESTPQPLWNETLSSKGKRIKLQGALLEIHTYMPSQTSSTLGDTLEEHFLVWPSDSFPDLQQSTMGPRQAIDVPRDSINIQTRPWPTSNGVYVTKFRGIWNLRAMAMKQLRSHSEPEGVVAVLLPTSHALSVADDPSLEIP